MDTNQLINDIKISYMWRTGYCIVEALNLDS